MTAHMPPVPPAGRSPKGAGTSGHQPKPHDEHAARDIDTHEQGEPGNMHQNTTNQGYQQDR